MCAERAKCWLRESEAKVRKYRGKIQEELYSKCQGKHTLDWWSPQRFSPGGSSVEWIARRARQRAIDLDYFHSRLDVPEIHQADGTGKERQGLFLHAH